MSLQRPDDFEERRQHLASLDDEQLKSRFWDLLDKITDPLIDLARAHTSPSIERSIALRMGFSSIEAKALIAGLAEHGMMNRGIGRAVVNVMNARGCSAREAGLALINEKCWNIAKGGI